MTIDIFLFYFFSASAILASLMVISLSNAVHSVLFLILVFCNVAGLLLLLGAEFLSFMLIIVYVGAIAVLFLFVVMMLNIKSSNIHVNIFSLFPVGILVFFILFNQLSTSAYELNLTENAQHQNLISWIVENNPRTNIEVVGEVLYTHYGLLFLVCSLILLVAMIGAIVLTMHQRINSKKQKIELQLVRKPGNVIKFVTLRNK